MQGRERAEASTRPRQKGEMRAWDMRLSSSKDPHAPQNSLPCPVGTSLGITDVNFLGLFPKPILQTLHQYSRRVEKCSNDKNEFMNLIDKLITAFIYRPITIQKVIQIMLTKRKAELEYEEHDNNVSTEDNENTGQESSASDRTLTILYTKTPEDNAPRLSRPCYANKCRLLQAKGILRLPVFCVKG